MTQLNQELTVPMLRIQLVRDSSTQYDESKRIVVDSPNVGEDIVRPYLEVQDREHFIVVLLDTKNKVIGMNVVSIGDLNSALVHPREVFKPAILANANCIILAHNHPSGDPTPSPEDIAVTKRLIEAGNILQIEILDHLIVGSSGKSLSLKKMGHI